MATKVTHFMIHPHAGRPKFWAKLMDGSCLFGSLCTKGIKRDDSAGDPNEKQRKGYEHIAFLNGVLTDDDVDQFVQLATMGRLIGGTRPTKTVVDLVVDARRTGIDFSRTFISGLEMSKTVSTNAAVPVDEPQKKRRNQSLFVKSYKPEDQEYSF